MKLKLRGNDIVSEDFSETVKIGEFTNNCLDVTKKNIVLHANFGQDFLNIYESYRNNFHIANVCDMLKQMEVIFEEYSSERKNVKRRWAL